MQLHADVAAKPPLESSVLGMKLRCNTAKHRLLLQAGSSCARLGATSIRAFRAGSLQTDYRSSKWLEVTRSRPTFEVLWPGAFGRPKEEEADGSSTHLVQGPAIAQCGQQWGCQPVGQELTHVQQVQQLQVQGEEVGESSCCGALLSASSLSPCMVTDEGLIR